MRQSTIERIFCLIVVFEDGGKKRGNEGGRPKKPGRSSELWLKKSRAERLLRNRLNPSSEGESRTSPSYPEAIFWEG
jgi:hypothetical protein